MTITLHKGDLPSDVDLGNLVAVDTETMGLQPHRDRLCLVQLSSGDGNAHLVQLSPEDYAKAKNLKKLLSDSEVIKIFHYARFDVAITKKYLEVDCEPIYCTRTASRLARTYTDRHGLRQCCRDLLDIDINKQQQSSNWGADELTPEQLEYAATDVYHLHALKEKLDEMLETQDRTDLAQKCFDFIGTRAELDLRGWANEDIFAH